MILQRQRLRLRPTTVLIVVTVSPLIVSICLYLLIGDVIYMAGSQCDNYLMLMKSRDAIRKLWLCPNEPAKLNLHGPINVNLSQPSWLDLERRAHDLELGGHWEPTECVARHNVAIIVPYRDRETQLLLFLQHIHPYLKKQKISYTIYVIQQIPGKAFNRGLLRNIGFLEAERLRPQHECALFHDVDLLPLDERNMYTCPDQPRHVCVAVNYVKDFMPLYKNHFAEFGHVTFFRNDHFKMVNGYSNLYLGWGAEDDDLHQRVQARKMHVYRYPDDIGRYYGIPHADEALLPRPHSLARNVSRFKLLNMASRRMDKDGLNSAQYKVLNITKSRLFTRITVDVEEDKYALQALKEEQLYSRLYGDLDENWRDFPETPSPFWWLNKTLAKKLGRFGGNSQHRKRLRAYKMKMAKLLSF